MADSDPNTSNSIQPDAAPAAALLPEVKAPLTIPAPIASPAPAAAASPEIKAPTTIPEPIIPPAPAALAVVPESKPLTIPTAAPIRKSPPPRDPLSKFRHNPEDEGAPMSFIDHLMELRKRLWVCIIAVLLCIVAGVIFYGPIYGVLTGPIDGINAYYAGPPGDIYRNMNPPVLPPGLPAIQLSTTTPLSNMMLIIWMGFWGGLTIASPLVLYQVWAFVAPGLKTNEKKAIMPVLYGGLMFFLAGVVICYKWMIPPTLSFFISLDLSLKNKINWTADTTIDLMLWMMIISGLLCEIPLIVAAMAKMDVIRGTTLTRHWRGMTFGAILIGAVVAPGNDLASMGVFSGLMLGIYLVSIGMAFLFQQKAPKKDVKKEVKKA